MFSSRKYLICLVLGLLFVFGTSSVYGDPGNTHTTVHETVSWTIAAGQCPSLPAGLSVTGTGERHMVTNTRVNADGSMDIVINDLVVGDAVDSDGGTYHFKYSNHSTQHVPPSGLPIEYFMTDSFVMNGSGAAGHLSAGFVMQWLVTDPSDTSWPPPGATVISTHGDPFHCDPL